MSELDILRLTVLVKETQFDIFVWMTNVHIFCTFLTGGLARHKGYSNFWGAITGLFMGPLGVLYYAGLPEREKIDR